MGSGKCCKLPQQGPTRWLGDIWSLRTIFLAHEIELSDSDNGFFASLPWRFHANPFGSLCAKLLTDRLAATLRGSWPGVQSVSLIMTSLMTHTSETIRDREKRRPPRPMKSSELSNGENHIALRQLLQNRKLRHLFGFKNIQDGNCKKWLERILVLVRSTI